MLASTSSGTVVQARFPLKNAECRVCGGRTSPSSPRRSIPGVCMDADNKKCQKGISVRADGEAQSTRGGSAPRALGRESAPSTSQRELRRLVLRSMLALPLLLQLEHLEPARAEGEKTKYSNLDDARVAGERIREEKEKKEGRLVTLPSGVRFRELSVGTGPPLREGDTAYIYYTLYRFNGYYLDSVGYGNEGKDDVGETFSFKYGEGQLPRAVELAMEGMRVGGERRVSVAPDEDWINGRLLPRPTSGAASRRFATALQKQTFFEFELVKVRPAKSS